MSPDEIRPHADADVEPSGGPPVVLHVNAVIVGPASQARFSRWDLRNSGGKGQFLRIDPEAECPEKPGVVTTRSS